MASRDDQRPVQPSVLDRLIDRDDGGTGEWGQSVARYKASVLRDLEWLLNTRRTPEAASEDFPELRRSVYHYGLPDLSSLSADSTSDRRFLLHEVERTIELFEPRLDGVQVSLAKVGEAGRPEIRFSVRGLLRMEPSPERVSFDTVLSLASGRFAVEGG